MQGVHASSLTAGAGQMQGRFGMRLCTWRVHGQGAEWLGWAEVASFLWLVLTVISP